MEIGVVALQGGVRAHVEMLERVGHSARSVRRPAQLEGLGGLVLPGGESTTQLRLIRSAGLWEPLDRFVRAGHPTLATCAGLILAARDVEHAGPGPPQDCFGWLDVTVSRNGWGRQLDSAEAVDDAGRSILLIRAPRITNAAEGVEILAAFRGEPVLVRRGAVIGATFHPELVGDSWLHELAFGPRADTRSRTAPVVAHRAPE